MILLQQPKAIIIKGHLIDPQNMITQIDLLPATVLNLMRLKTLLVVLLEKSVLKKVKMKKELKKFMMLMFKPLTS